MNCSGKETITLTTKHSQLSFIVTENGYLTLAYFGKKLPKSDLSYVIMEIPRASYLADTDSIENFKLEQLPVGYPAFGNSDLRSPAHQEIYADGSRLSDFRYVDHSFSKIKQQLNGLPYANTERLDYLIIELSDRYTGVSLHLKITAFQEQDVFTQSVTFSNPSDQEVVLTKAMSLNLDFLTDDFELLLLSGAWGREMHLSRRKLVQGLQGIDSKRGASGHGQNPFIALVSPDTTEAAGAVIACQLMYSGNFVASAEVDMHQNTRMQIGINPFDFSWTLAPSESFDTPEAIFLYADGLNQMSQKFHAFYEDCVVPRAFKNKERPILLNNWEATYFDFDQERILRLANEGAKIGIECFVLDDGWFGKRENERTSLGDWTPNQEKLGGSLQQLITAIKELGLDFGLWIEPEMVSKKSLLYQQHPEWIVRVPNRRPQQVRYQYVLDLSLNEVQKYLIEQITWLLDTHEINYLKWDMNRNITDSFSSGLKKEHQQEFSHRYILGLYHVLETITKRFPNVLIESCAGGGGRFDPGMLYYTPQIWTSDDSDAIARLEIQKGTSLLYPPSTMGCHVTASPNHQVGRVTSLHTRALVAQQGNFGYELNLLALSEAEKDCLAQQIKQYKLERQTLQFGQQTRLAVYDSQNEYAWQKQNLVTSEVIVTHINILNKPNTVPKRLKLKSLKNDQLYQVNDTVRSGAELMEIGLMIPKPSEDFFATRWKIMPIKET